MKLTCNCESAWPPLAWLARLERGTGEIRLTCGPQVETRPRWFAEATWDGPFGHGGFDRTDIVFGSGCRLRDGHAMFVSSTSPCDRLQYLETEDAVFVSNSVACLIASLDLRIDPWYPNYYEDIFASVRGIDEAIPELATSGGPIRFCYFHNLRWDGARIGIDAKPFPRRDFGDFGKYRGFLESVMSDLGRNMRSRARTVRYEPISTASSGYDSLCVSLLSRAAGNRDVISMLTSRSGVDDSGAGAARSAGFKVREIDREAWRESSRDLVQFVAADACGRDVMYAPAREFLARRVLFSGHHGGVIWGTGGSFRGALLDRKDNAGSSLGEFRLHAGFLHCAFPYVGARQLEDIRELSLSEEMRPWSVGGDYDRPIPRRIIEQAGIRRTEFAVAKRATHIHLFRLREFSRFMPGSDAFRDYAEWLRTESAERPVPGSYEKPVYPLNKIDVPLFRHLFPWAIDRMRPLYRDGTA